MTTPKSDKVRVVEMSAGLTEVLEGELAKARDRAAKKDARDLELTACVFTDRDGRRCSAPTTSAATSGAAPAQARAAPPSHPRPAPHLRRASTYETAEPLSTGSGFRGAIEAPRIASTRSRCRPPRTHSNASPAHPETKIRMRRGMTIS